MSDRNEAVMVAKGMTPVHVRLRSRLASLLAASVALDVVATSCCRSGPSQSWPSWPDRSARCSNIAAWRICARDTPAWTTSRRRGRVTHPGHDVPGERSGASDASTGEMVIGRGAPVEVVHRVVADGLHAADDALLTRAVFEGAPRWAIATLLGTVRAGATAFSYDLPAGTAATFVLPAGHRG
jgi:hypothetical protein